MIGCSRTLDNNIQPLLPTPFTFERHEILTGTEKHQTILTGFILNGERAEIVVVNLDENKNRNLTLYSFYDDKWEQKICTQLNPNMLFVNIAKIDRRDRLITYEHGQLNWYDPELDTEHNLIAIKTNYKPLNANEIPHIDISQDLNGDGRDDFVLPDIDGYWISTQLDKGQFTEPIKLGPPDPFLDETALDEKHTYRDVGINSITFLWYMTRFHLMDYDGDKRDDIVFWNEDHFDVYRQSTQGTFSTAAESFTVDIPFDYDGAYTLAFGYSDENTFKLISGFRKKTQRKVLHLFRDVNNDGAPDMVIHTLEGRSIGNLKSLYEIYFGNMGYNGLKYNTNDKFTIRPKGKAGGLLPWGYAYQWWQDFDGDGHTDILFKDVNTAFGGMVRAMVGKSIAIDLEAYRMQDGTYPHKPTFKYKIRPTLDFFEKHRVFFPVVLIGDVHGDNRLDILIGKSWKEMSIYPGIPGQQLIAKEPQKVKIVMPNDERNMWLVDMNNDKKQDILVYHPNHAESHRLILLVSK